MDDYIKFYDKDKEKSCIICTQSNDFDFLSYAEKKITELIK